MAFPIILTLALASAFSAGFVVAMMPILRRYALARPNARSSHAEPTPQGAGLAVVLATVLATAIGLVFAGAGQCCHARGRDRARGVAPSRRDRSGR